MFKNIFTKTLYDKRWFAFGWSLGLIAMVALTLVFFPSLSQGNSIEQLFANIPKQLQGLLGDLEAYRTAAGYLGSAVFDLRVPLVALPMAIILAISLSAGEESSGQMYQLLARPVSRASIVIQKWLAFVVVMTVVHISALLSVVVTLFAIDESVSYATVVGIVLMSALLCVSVGSTAMLFAFGSGKKGFATAASSLLAFGSYLVTSFSTQVSWLKEVNYVSFFRYYQPVLVVRNGLDLTYVLVLVGVAVVALGLSIVLFSHRDIGLSS